MNIKRTTGEPLDESASVQNKQADDKPKKVCGIVMPIAAMGDSYSETHWQRVRKIIQSAIHRADMQSQLVWENPEWDVIQSAILQNLYENDVVVCDVSGLNPNVMLEVGLRLSTKRPTIIITDREMKPPFDISTIGYLSYQKDLEYNSTDDFILRLSNKIAEVATAYDEKKYKSFVENYTFENVMPETVTISVERRIQEQLDGMLRTLARIERSNIASRGARPVPYIDNKSSIKSMPTIPVTFAGPEEYADKITDAAMTLSGVHSVVDESEDGMVRLTIQLHPDVTKGQYLNAKEHIALLIGLSKNAIVQEMAPDETRWP